MHGIRFRAPFTRSEEVSLIREYKASAQLKNQEVTVVGNFHRLENCLFEAYLPLVELVSKRVYKANRRYLIDQDELTSAGYEGLMQAFHRFNPDRGYRFATYASWWILDAVTRAVRSERWIIGISDHRYRQVKRLTLATHSLQQCLGRRPTPVELAGYLNLSLQKLALLFAWTGGQTVSIDTPVGDGTSCLADFIQDERADPPIVALENSNILQWVMGLLEELPERERVVLQYRFGLFGVPVCTVDEIAIKVGATAKGVRYMEGRAIARLISELRRQRSRRLAARREIQLNAA